MPVRDLYRNRINRICLFVCLLVYLLILRDFFKAISSCNCRGQKAQNLGQTIKLETQARVDDAVLTRKLQSRPQDWKLRQDFFVTVLGQN